MAQCLPNFCILQVTNTSAILLDDESLYINSLDLRTLHRGPHLSDAAAGAAGDDDADTALIRDEWIRHQLELRSNEYCSKREIVYVLPIVLDPYLPTIRRVEFESGTLMSMDEHLHPA
jgi:hypothetical protein